MARWGLSIPGQTSLVCEFLSHVCFLVVQLSSGSVPLVSQLSGTSSLCSSYGKGYNRRHDGHTKREWPYLSVLSPNMPLALERLALAVSWGGIFPIAGWIIAVCQQLDLGCPVSWPICCSSEFWCQTKKRGSLLVAAGLRWVGKKLALWLSPGQGNIFRMTEGKL